MEGYVYSRDNDIAKAKQALETKYKNHPKVSICKNARFDKEHIDNLIEKVEKTAHFEVSTKEDAPKMPPKYADGSFREKGNTLEYRFLHNKKQVTVCGKTKEICYDKRTDIISGKRKTKSTKTLLLLDYFRSYYRTFKTKKDGTKINPTNELVIENVLARLYPKLPLKQFTILMAKELMKEYEDRPNRQKKLRTFMNEVFTMAVAEGHIKTNPMSSIKLERHEAESFNAIQPNEQRLILDSIKEPKYEAAFWYFCCSGLRLDTALKSIDLIDFERCVIVSGKKNTRTKKHETEIPFLPEILTPEKVSLLKTLSKRQTQQYFKDLFQSLGLDAVLHSCRKTFASCAYHVGFSDKWIQEKLCHSTIDMTMNTYVKLMNNEDSPILDYFRRLKAKLGL